MTDMNTVAWFEIGTADVAATKSFYGPLFGWSFKPEGDYTLITSAEAQAPTGGIFNTGGNIPPYAVFVVRVADVETAANQAEELGGKVIVAPRTIDSGMSIAYVADPNGSVFGLWSRPDA